jgi:cobyrinic acid a,c-diamide synthase
VALDESFNFYYTDNLIALRRSGAQLSFFSPVKDQTLPDGVHGIIVGGGFPEVLADKLETNGSMIRSIREAVDEGMPIYAECGGLMYLTRSITGYKGEKKARKMAGIIQADTLMTGKLTLNYTDAECQGSILGKTHLRGHEFHYSSIENVASDSRFAYAMKKGKGVIGSLYALAFCKQKTARADCALLCPIFTQMTFCSDKAALWHLLLRTLQSCHLSFRRLL